MVVKELIKLLQGIEANKKVMPEYIAGEHASLGEDAVTLEEYSDIVCLTWWSNKHRE